MFDQPDYRRFLSAHLQFLQQLCQLSIQSVNSSIGQFLSSLFITNQLLSEESFNDRLLSLIEQMKSNAPMTFNQFLTLVQNINHGNAIVSSYGTNYKYTAPRNTGSASTAYTEALVYNGCSCGLYMNCTTQANFIEKNSSKTYSLQGLKIGCTPSESFRASTLACFYNQSCLNLIRQYTNYSGEIAPLLNTGNQFAVTMSIGNLLKELFVEDWNITRNYPSYFERCAPLMCSHTHAERFSFLHTIALLLSFQGGLTIVLKWICPQIVRMLTKIYSYRQRKRVSVVQPVQPVYSVQMPPVEVVSKIIYEPSFKFESNRIDEAPRYISFFSPVLFNHAQHLFI